MKYAYSFLDLMVSLEGILGGGVYGRIADAITLAVTPGSTDFAVWMTTPDPEAYHNQDHFTPDHIEMKLAKDEDGREYLEAPKIGGMEVLPYILHESSRAEYYLLTEDAGSNQYECEERKLDWMKPSEYYMLAEKLTKELLPVREQHHEDYFWYVNQDIERKDIRYALKKDGALTVYVELCSMINDNEARLEAELYIRVEAERPAALVKLALSVIKKFAELSGCFVQTESDEYLTD